LRCLSINAIAQGVTTHKGIAHCFAWSAQLLPLAIRVDAAIFIVE